jgi:serine/threonine-protein kinase
MSARSASSDNLFVTREGVVKVLDFGIARLREGSAAKGTHTGISMGTPAFMAREQARALWDEVDARTDLWAVGATMFTCLTGRTVHEGRTPNEQLLSAMTKPAPALRSLAPHVPGPVAFVVDRALAVESVERFQSASEMQAAVRGAYEQLRAQPISTAPRLLVPDVALHATMPAAELEGPTVQGVAAGRTGASAGGTSTKRPTAIIVSSGVAIGAVVIAAAVIASRGGAPKTAATGNDAPPASAAPPATSAPTEPASASASPPPPPAASASASAAPAGTKRREKGPKGDAKADPPAPPPPTDDPLGSFRRKK